MYVLVYHGPVSEKRHLLGVSGYRHRHLSQVEKPPILIAKPFDSGVIFTSNKNIHLFSWESKVPPQSYPPNK